VSTIAAVAVHHRDGERPEDRRPATVEVTVE
jgi:hypothetical protein